MKKLLSIVDSNGAQQKAVITESVSAAAVSKTEQYFKAVNNEVLQNIKEQQVQKKIEVKRVVSRVLDKLEEGKTTKDKPAVRNFVAKNAPKAGAGAHKDKKKAEKQGDTKHKKELVPMDEERTEVRDKDGKVTSWKDEGEWKKSTANKDGRGKVTNLSDKARRETEKLSKKEKDVAEVAGAQKCWPGHKKVGTQPGTGKNAGKRVNDCEKIEEDEVEESGLQYYTGVKKHGEKYMKKAAAAGRDGASQKELGALKDKYSKAYKEGTIESDIDEAEYQGRNVPLGKKMAGDVKKSKVYVKNPQGNVVKVNFGDKKMRIKKSNPARRKSFRARHNCANPGPRHKARYWSCRSW